MEKQLMKDIMLLPVGTKLIVTKISKKDGWYIFREDIIGHEFIKSENGNYSYIKLPESISDDFDNKEGYFFYSSDYTIIPA